jgi:hypothetical protein
LGTKGQHATCRPLKPLKVYHTSELQNIPYLDWLRVTNKNETFFYTTHGLIPRSQHGTLRTRLRILQTEIWDKGLDEKDKHIPSIFNDESTESFICL